MSNMQYSKEQWNKIFSFLIKEKHVYTCSESDCRRFLDAIQWMARSGAQWRLLPEKYGNWNTIYNASVIGKAKAFGSACLIILSKILIWRIF